MSTRKTLYWAVCRPSKCSLLISAETAEVVVSLHAYGGSREQLHCWADGSECTGRSNVKVLDWMARHVIPRLSSFPLQSHPSAATSPHWPSGHPPRDPGFESRLRRDFSRSSHTSDFKIGAPVATLPGAWPCRVSAGTDWPGVNML